MLQQDELGWQGKPTCLFTDTHIAMRPHEIEKAQHKTKAKWADIFQSIRQLQYRTYSCPNSGSLVNFNNTSL